MTSIVTTHSFCMSDRLDLTPLRNAVASLVDSLRVVDDTGWFTQQQPAVQNTLLAGVLQNFEFVYELSVKMLKRQLERESATPGEIDQLAFRDQLRVAHEKGLIADVEAWFRHRQMRGTTSHTYDQQKARQAYQNVAPFLLDARALLAALETRNA
jgi:nucleotidyltransferase substrate binding protein (TIGR01987 family)